MHRRLNITLPDETVRLLDRLGKRGDRSRIIAEAVTYYVEEIGKGRLRKLIQEGARKRAERDLSIAEEGFEIEEGGWSKGRD